MQFNKKFMYSKKNIEQFIELNYYRFKIEFKFDITVSIYSIRWIHWPLMKLHPKKIYN